MSEIKHTLSQKKQRVYRTRARLKGTATRPRLSVNISHLHVSAQLIDDQAGRTLAYTTTARQKVIKGSLSDKAKWVGADIAKKAKSAKINKVVFDRGNKLYHGRVKILAEAAREGGLKF